MKIFVIILKVLMMIATGVIAVVLNILGLISLITTETTDVSSIMGILIFWMVFTVICYIVPVFFAMLKKYFICGGLTFAGMICVLVLHELLPGDPGYLYMPLLIITILGILLAALGETADHRGQRGADGAIECGAGAAARRGSIRSNGIGKAGNGHIS